MTRDIDIVVKLDEGNLDGFIRAFEADHYVSRESALRAIRSGSMFNIIDQANVGKIDCIVLKTDEFSRESFGRRYQVPILGRQVWFISKADLIVSKLKWARDTISEMQIRDIANLTDTEYDEELVARWVEKLELASIWNEVNNWKTLHRKPAN